ncbi:MAG: hypothetical protein WA418_21540 [Bradyrhizobium sp.]
MKIADELESDLDGKISEESKLKITILLAEYNTLRSEAIARGGHFYQTIAIGGTALSLIVSASASWLTNAEKMSHVYSQVSIALIVTAVAIAGVVLGVLLWLIQRDLKKCAERIQELEIDVNERAGEDLLIWENLWGGSETGYWGSARPLRRGKLSASTRPERSKRGRYIT